MQNKNHILNLSMTKLHFAIEKLYPVSYKKIQNLT